MTGGKTICVGVLSDTHGRLNPMAKRVFRDNDVAYIIHAGDVCGDAILAELSRIAPVTHVRGNMDSWETGEPTAVLDIPGMRAYVLHDLYLIDIDPAAAQMNAVIHGHTHHAEVDQRGGVLYLNPGSASSPRGHVFPSVAIVSVTEAGIDARIVRLR